MELQHSNAVWWYLNELTSRVIAESGRPSDRYHIGKILLRSLKDVPNFIMQIDGATNERDTFQSAMERSVRCASALRNFGLKYQDVIVIMAPNHIDLTIPMYAALYIGVAVAGVDMLLGVNELKDTLKFTSPKIIFCENFNVGVVQDAIKLLNIAPLIVTFGEKRDHNLSFTKFIENYSGNTTVDNFRPAEFDPVVTNALLVATSGSTGLPKAAILTHENIFTGFPSVFFCSTKFPTPFETTIVLSPIQWISSLFQFILSPILRFTRVQTSSPYTPDHVYSLINKYKPEYTLMSATFLTTLLKPGERDKCDFSSFKYLMIGGSAVTKKLLREIEKVSSNTITKIGYGMSESSGVVANSVYSPQGSIGLPNSNMQFKIIDPMTNERVRQSNVIGELILKGPNIAKGYYNNPAMTAATFDEDGWFRTGDLVYRDEYFNLYFVDRLKLLLKYRNHQVSPVEIENIIIKHHGVLDAAVTGVPDDECGDLPVAFVVPHEGCDISGHEIKDLVKASLTDTKQLRGGVVFLKELPTTRSGKVDRQKLKQMAARLKKQ